LLLREERAMGILLWIVFGLIAGAAAKLLHPGDDPGGSGPIGWLITIGIGIIGAIIGGFIGSAVGWGGVDGFNLGSFLLAIGGGLLFLVIWSALTGRGRKGAFG
jgi:uncharacterized membrane protein YeaQ/YmgE (transglycosylase-associated protein family)